MGKWVVFWIEKWYRPGKGWIEHVRLTKFDSFEEAHKFAKEQEMIGHDVLSVDWEDDA